MKAIKVTNLYGIIIRKDSLKKLKIDCDRIDVIMENNPLDKNDDLLSYGPNFGKEAADEFIKRLENVGLQYIDDFFIFEGDFPHWVKFRCEFLNE